MSHDHGQVCRCVFDHRPPVLEGAWHHVVPTYLGGPDDESNLIYLCPTSHANVHELLRFMLREGRALTYAECQDREDRPVSRYAHTVALDGYSRWAATQ